MGSFNLGCGISNLSINEGDVVGLSIIVPSSNSRDESSKLLYFYTNDLYSIHLPPIYGEYDDYGGLDLIETSRTTELLEDTFKKPVADLIKAIGSDRSIFSPYSKISELYMDREALDALSDFKASSADKLAALGFVKRGQNARTKYVFDKYEISYPDGEREKFVVRERKTGAQLGRETSNFEVLLDSFSTLTGLTPGFGDRGKLARKLTTVSGMVFYRDVFEAMKSHMAKEYDNEQAVTMSETQFNGICNELESTRLYNSAKSDSSRKFGARSPEEWESFVKHLSVSDYLEMDMLHRVLTAVNRLVMPSFCGEQYGNDPASAELLKVSKKILKSRPVF